MIHDSIAKLCRSINLYLVWEVSRGEVVLSQEGFIPQAVPSLGKRPLQTSRASRMDPPRAKLSLVFALCTLQVPYEGMPLEGFMLLALYVYQPAL